MAMNLSNPNPIINKEVLTKFAVKFSVGADILKLGNRQFEKELGAENMSGSSVDFCVADGGAIQENDLDLSNVGTKGGARRVKKRAVTLESITAYFQMGQEDLDLLIDSSEFGSKCTAKALESVQTKAYNLLKGVASAEVADDANGLVDAFMNAQAYLEASKMDGELCGMANVWNDKAISSAYAKVGISTGGSLFEASKQKGLDAGSGFMGFKWAKATAGQNVRIKGVEYKDGSSNASTIDSFFGRLESDGSIVIEGCVMDNAPTAYVPASGSVRVDSPFSIAGLNLVDELGEDLGVAMTFTGTAKKNSTTATSADITFDKEVRFANVDATNGTASTSEIGDPLANATKPCTDNFVISGSAVTLTPTNNLAVTGLLTKDAYYYQPVLLWKKDEFLVAVKGLKAMKGADSDTIPAQFGGDKGIIPWRGTAWSVEEKSQHWTRFDAYFGFGYLKGIAVRAIYIKA